MRSLTPTFLDTLRLTAVDGSTLTALGERRGRQELFRRQIPELLSALRDAAIIESTESSNRIEGVVAPHERVEALVLKTSTPRNRSEQEIAGYRDALNLIHESAREMAFSVNVILQLHTILYRYHAGSGGRWKPTQNEIVERDADAKVQRVRFVPTSPVATPGLMDAIAAEYGRAVAEEREPLILVPLAILDFLCIHPFADGNGRMARLLTLQLLYHFDFDVGRYISLERIVEESKETYYEALEASSRQWHEGRHDALPWLRYFWGVVLRAYREFEQRVGTLRTGRGAKTDLVEEAIARRVGAFSISDIEKECPGVSRDWIRMVLRRQRDERRIVRRGKGRGSKWVRQDT
ncbi:MAG: Fic family protein [Gemmatimonadaceae bacterium]